MAIFLVLHLPLIYQRIHVFSANEHMYERTQKFYPDEIEMLHSMALLSFRQNDSKQAYAYLNRLEQMLIPKNRISRWYDKRLYWTYALRIKFSFNQKDFETIDEMFERCFANVELLGRCNYIKGTILNNYGNYDQAYKLLENAKGVRDDKIELAKAYVGSGQFRKADHLMLKIIPRYKYTTHMNSLELFFKQMPNPSLELKSLIEKIKLEKKR